MLASDALILFRVGSFFFCHLFFLDNSSAFFFIYLAWFRSFYGFIKIYRKIRNMSKFNVKKTHYINTYKRYYTRLDMTNKISQKQWFWTNNFYFSSSFYNQISVSKKSHSYRSRFTYCRRRMPSSSIFLSSGLMDRRPSRPAGHRVRPKSPTWNIWLSWWPQKHDSCSSSIRERPGLVWRLHFYRI